MIWTKRQARKGGGAYAAGFWGRAFMAGLIMAAPGLAFAQAPSLDPAELRKGRNALKPPQLVESPDWKGEQAAHLTKIGPATCLFQDGLATPDNWTLSGLWHFETNSNCAVSAPGYATSPGALVFNFQGTCSYDEVPPRRQRGFAELNQDFLIPNALAAFLSFQHHLELEEAFDAAFVEVSTQGGAEGTWEATDFVRKSNTDGWEEAVVDLSGYILDTVRVRFGFDTFDGQFNDFNGWYIDDIRLCTSVVPDGASGIFVRDIEVVEGDIGITYADFIVSVEPPYDLPFGLRYRTLDGERPETAATVEDRDYEPVEGTLVFEPGETEKLVRVMVYGDPFEEPDEEFRLELFDVRGGDERLIEARMMATCTILNDDVSAVFFGDSFSNSNRWQRQNPWRILSAEPSCFPIDVERPASMMAYTIDTPLPPQPTGDFFTQQFTQGIDLENRSILFEWVDPGTGDPGFYEACIRDVDEFFVDPATATTLALGDDAFAALNVPGGNTIPFFGVDYPNFFVGSNGYITFGAGDTRFTETIERHFDTPRISALFDDLNPAQGGPNARVSWQAQADRVAVTFENIPKYFNSGANTFQVEMFFNGNVRITWLRIDTQDGIVGISDGNGIPAGFVESDFTGDLAVCPGATSAPPPPRPVNCAYPPNLLRHATLLQPLALPPATDVILRIRDYSDIEADNDRYFIELSADNGSTWDTIFERRESTREWQVQSIDISAYAGRSVLFRLGFEADATNESLGWFLDWLRVSAVNLPEGYSVVYIEDAEGEEGNPGDDGRIEFQVNVVPPNPEPITLSYATSDFPEVTPFTAQSNLPPDAIPGNDYVPAEGTLTIAPNTSTATIGVDLIGDPYTEADETFYLDIFDASFNGIIAQGRAIGTILNDDPVSVITINDIEVLEGDPGDEEDDRVSARFTLTIDPPNLLPITVDYETIEGTALEDIDYESVSGTLTIPAMAERAFILIRVISDVFPEEDETFYVELTNPSVNARLGSTAGLASIRGKCTIIDDDEPDLLLYADFEPGTTLNWNLSGDWHFANNSDCIAPPAITGTRALAWNTSASTGLCTIRDTGGADNIAYFDLPLQIPSEALVPQLSWWQWVEKDSDTEFEVFVDPGTTFTSMQTLYLAPSNSTGGWEKVTLDLGDQIGQQFYLAFNVIRDSGVPEPAEAAGWFIDELTLTYVDASGFVTLSVADIEIVEGNVGFRDAVFTVDLNRPAPQPLQIDYTTRDRTATAGEDYLPRSGTVVFAPGDETQAISVPVRGDWEIEPNETFELKLSNPSPEIFVQRNIATCTIINDDFPSGTLFGFNRESAPFGLFRASVDKPTEAVTIAESASYTFAGAEFQGYDFSTLYAIEPTENELYGISTNDGSSRSVARLPIPTGAWKGLAWDARGGKLHVLSSDDADSAEIYPVEQSIVAFTPQRPDDFVWPIREAFTNRFERTRSQYVYPAEFLQGVTEISSLSFLFDDVNNFHIDSLEIRMKHVNYEFFPSQTWDTSNLQLLYTGTNERFSTGWFTFTLDTPFSYDGTSHLLLDIALDSQGTFGVAGNSVRSVFLKYFANPMNWQRALHLNTSVGPPAGVWGPGVGPTPSYGEYLPWVRFGSFTANAADRITVSPAPAPKVTRALSLAIHPVTGDMYLLSRAESGVGAVLSQIETGKHGAPGSVRVAEPLVLGGVSAYGVFSADMDFDDSTAELYISLQTDRIAGLTRSELFRVRLDADPMTSGKLLDGPPILAGTLANGSRVEALAISSPPSPPGVEALFDIGVRTAPGLRIEGKDEGDILLSLGEFWMSGSGVGDVNGNGYEDFVVTFPSTSPDGRIRAGETYLIFGGEEIAPGRNGRLRIAEFDSSLGVRIPGVAANGGLGVSVTGIGDINQDGFDDFLISAPFVTRDGLPNRGVVYIVYGSPNFGSVLNLGSGIASEVVVLTGPTGGDLTGFSVSGAGDVNGDGFPDFLIGAPGWNNRGRAYLVYGSPTRLGGLSGEFNLNDLDADTGMIFESTAIGAGFGSSVAGLGDVNGDGYADFIMGAPSHPAGNQVGAAYVVRGARNLGASGSPLEHPVSLSMNSPVPTQMALIQGIALLPFQRAGGAVAGVGDVTGDGFADIAIAAPGLSLQSGIDQAGGVWIISGDRNEIRGEKLLSNLTASNSPSLLITGTEADSAAGFSISSAGDFNGDGYADFIIGVHQATVGGVANAGAAYLIFGGPHLLGANLEIDLDDLRPETGLRLFGGGEDHFAGRAVSVLGDVNGDGYTDILVAAPGADPEDVANAGEAYVLYGGPQYGPAKLDGVAIYRNHIRTGQGQAPAQGVPAPKLQVDPVPVGVSGDGRVQRPFSRVAIGYTGGGVGGTALEGASEQEVRLIRNPVPMPESGIFRPSRVHWRVQSERQGYTESQVRFWYTEDDLVIDPGDQFRNPVVLDRDAIDIFYTEEPPGPDTQWRIVNALHDRNDRTFTVVRDEQSNPRIDGYYAIMELDLRYEIGREIPRPFEVDVDMIAAQGPTVIPEGAAYWHAKSRKLFAVREGAITIQWPNNVVVDATNVWPEDLASFQLHVAGTPPVDLSAGGAFLSADVLFSQATAGANADLARTDLLFESPGAGNSLVLLSDGAEPQGFDIFFIRVKSIAWNDPAFLFGLNEDDPILVDIGQPIDTSVFQHNTLCGGPFVYFEQARVNAYPGYYDRAARTGPIIPVNLRTPGSTSTELAVVYYSKGLSVYDPQRDALISSQSCWGTIPVRYTAKWPDDPKTVVIAGDFDEAALPDTRYDSIEVYTQNDPSQMGYNPNEEHAFVFASRVYALRDDLNSTESEPYVLVNFRDKFDNMKPKVEVFRVVREMAPTLTFDYPEIAGRPMTAPVPIQALAIGQCGDASFSVPEPSEGATLTDAPIYRDRQDVLWAYRAGHDGGPENVSMFYYYPPSPAFYFPQDLYPDGAPDCVPWLDFGAGTPGTPIEARYTIRWPDDPSLPLNQQQPVPVLQINQTLAQDDPWSDTKGTVDLLALTGDRLEDLLDRWQKNQAFLPSINNRCSVSVIYDQARANDLGPSVALFDYAQPRRIPLDALPSDIPSKLAGDYINLITLPPQLQMRLRYRETVDEFGIDDNYLEFRGVFINLVPGTEIGFILPNVITELDYHFLLGLSEDDDWHAAITDFWENNNDLLLVDDDSPPSFAVAVTSALAQRGGYVTLVFDNKLPDCELAPGLEMEIIKVDCDLFVDRVLPITPACVFDDQLTMRYAGDFAGAADDYIFEWQYLPDEGQDPRDAPDSQWINLTPPHPLGKEAGRGAVEVTIRGPGVIALSDNFFRVRFRHAPEGKDGTGPTGPCDPQSAWTFPQLGEGWIKRVVGEINPFTQRATGGSIAGAETQFFTYHEDEVNTTVNMLRQAGPRFEGNVALNCENLNDLQLIPTYQTVLGKGRQMSIDAATPISDYGPVNNALLLVTSRLSDLYMLFANEAYGDAADPTIGFGTTSGQFAEAATSIHCFMNQTASLIEEELALLRGRDDSRMPGVGFPPVYNRLYPNFTGDFAGQTAYFLNYAIQDLTGNASADERDALLVFPQGHGDAWGHYLTSVKLYYNLFADPNYVYRPRTETVLIGADPVAVDFFDERKFAAAAAAKARCGADIVNLTYRFYYTDNPNGQWQGYKDTNRERQWGVSEWAARAGQGAFFDWVTANALLPVENPEQEPSIEKIDRTTVLEIREIAGAFKDIQAEVEKANLGVNPLGLASNVVPFDIDPAGISRGETHFEQVYQRAVKAMTNAITVFNYANESTQRLRDQQDQVTEFRVNVDNRLFDLTNRLIEIYGYPYEGDIGPGRTYPVGYDGPDVYHFDYFDPSEIIGIDPGPIQQLTVNLPDFTLPEFASVHRTGQSDLSPQEVENPVITLDGTPTSFERPVTFHLSPNGFGTVRPDGWGQRRAPGEIQLARQDLWQAIGRYRIALDNYNGLVEQVEDKVKLLEMQRNIRATEIAILRAQTGDKETLEDYILRSKKREFNYRQGAKNTVLLANAVAEALPRFLVAGFSVGADYTSVIRGAIKAVGAVTESVLSGLADYEAVNVLEEEQALADVERQNSIILQTQQQDFAINQALGEIRNLLLNESTLRYELYNLQEAMQQQAGRYRSTLAKGLRTQEELMRFKRQTAAKVEQYRYRDMAFRIFRNAALQKYRAQFDLAARYVYLAAKAYDYETNLLRSDTRAGQQFLTDIVRARSIGIMQNGLPIASGAAGDPGLADPMARMMQNWEAVLRGQLGFNNPQTETNRFSLRSQLFRIASGRDGNAVWRETLERHIVPNVLELPEFQRYCRVFDNPLAQEPAIVIPFSTTVSFGLNFFGWPLAGGDSAYDSTNFATKVRSVGVWFSNYNNLGSGMSNTPRVYLIPVGDDLLRSPTSGDTRIRAWRVLDQKLPAPFALGSGDFLGQDWIPVNNSLTDQFADIRKYSMFRAYHDSGAFNPAETINDSRLIGRSVANTQWMLIIPAGTLSANRDEGLKRFIHGQLQPNGQRDNNGVSDIRLFFQTYAYSGN